MGLRAKRRSEITPAERKFLEKKFGVPGREYPMLGRREVRDTRGNVAKETFIGRLSDPDHPLIVTSERPDDEVDGLMSRNMPIPSMLEIWRELWRRMEIDSTIHAMMVKGLPGVGKTYGFDLAADIASYDPPIKIDCGDRNLEEMIFQTVLDLNSNKNLLKTINLMLAQGKAEDYTIHVLRENLGSAFHEENGRYAIDWPAIRVGNVFENETDPEKENLKKRIDKADLYRRLEEALNTFIRYEGLGNKTNPLGMNTQESEVIEAHKKGLFVIEDEFNRGKKNTHAALHGILQFVTGDDVDHLTVYSKLKEKGEESSNSYTFHHADDKIGTFYAFTGNTEEDGNDVFTLPESLNDRIVPITVPAPREYDWQHRWCQFLTIVPISTWHAVYEQEAAADPDAFRDFLKWKRVRGLKPEALERDATRINMHLRLLDRWENVNEATADLAKWCHGMSQFVNPESDALRNVASLGELLGEVDQRFKKEIAFGFRKIKYFINKAMKPEAEVLDPQDCEVVDLRKIVDKLRAEEEKKLQANVELGQLVPDDESLDGLAFDEDSIDWSDTDPLLNLGSRLSKVIEDFLEVHVRDAGKKKLYEHGRKLAIDCGIIAPSLNEARRSNKKTLAELLDLNPFLTPDVDLRAALVRDLLCDHLRTKYDDLSAINDEILPAAEIAAALADLESLNAALPETGPTSNVFGIVNSDIDGAEAYAPFRILRTVDTTPQRDEEKIATPSAVKLVRVEDFILALGVPALKTLNLSASWNMALSASSAAAEGAHADRALAMAEARSDTGFAITTVMLQHAGKPSPLHLVRNGKTDKTLLIGEAALTEPQQRYLQNGGITYINRHEANALQKIKFALRSAVNVTDDRLLRDMKAAFLYRSGFDSEQLEEAATLAELLADNDVKIYHGHYMTASPYPGVAPNG